jgi:hypothetical protein
MVIIRRCDIICLYSMTYELTSRVLRSLVENDLFLVVNPFGYSLALVVDLF